MCITRSKETLKLQRLKNNVITTEAIKYKCVTNWTPIEDFYTDRRFYTSMLDSALYQSSKHQLREYHLEEDWESYNINGKAESVSPVSVYTSPESCI